MTSRLNSFPKCGKVRKILLVLVFASNAVIACVCAYAHVLVLALGSVLVLVL